MDFILDIVINFIAFTNFLIVSVTLRSEKQFIEKAIAFLGLLGMAMVGMGLFISGVEKVYTYMYAILLIEVLLLLAMLTINHLIKWGKSNFLKNICILSLIVVNFFIYITYVTLTFI
ncbi:hypothetical protein [Listeria sp. PSOL-1]|uniref:hypothetical protein n=1 Tax=Listeria sp. PSOL-1 TaxID=1844999 RepID=UPI001E504C99|nr:hypothetical protein [Listeria sp. PSOL-1]